MKYGLNELTLIWIDSFSKIDYNRKKELFFLLKDKKEIKTFLETSKKDLSSFLGEENYQTLVNSANKEYFDYVFNRLSNNGVVALTCLSEDFPTALKNTEDCPLVLYCKGDLNLLNTEMFGVVGSRKSLPLSINLAENYTKALIEAEFTVVTGIAEGVDKTVLETALQENGKVISVLASGFDCVYPSAHQNLFDRVLEKGLAISEYPPEVSAKPYFFPVRNRIIAGLSKGVLVVNGGIKSGTLYTAEYAMEYGRDLFCIPYSVGVSSGAGNNELIKKGAFLTTSPEDVLAFYGIENKSGCEISDLTQGEKEIVDLLKEESLHVEQIADKLNKNIFEITPVLSILEIKGLIIKSGVNVYALARNMEE